MPGKEVVILGSGDIGLIMARRMTLEGAKVKVVAEIMPYSGGLKRNIVQCLEDYGIPLKLSHAVVNIDGKERIEGVTLAKVDGNMKPIPGTEEYISCDTLLLSVGLIPENELTQNMGIQIEPVTSGPTVNESLETSLPGVFACGNVLHVHDLVDYVSEEAAVAGRNAVKYVNMLLNNDSKEDLNDPKSEESITDEEALDESPCIELVATEGVRYTIPKYIHSQRINDSLKVRFRVGAIYKDCSICIYYDDQNVYRLKKKAMAPGEMEQIRINKKDLLQHPDVKRITISIEK
jgi:NAD(P)H-nitrite reductase large subunit